MAERESKITVPAVAVLALAGAIVVFLLGAFLQHERRITVIETNSSTIIGMLTEIKSDLKVHLNETKGEK